MSESLPKRRRVSRACDFCHTRGLKCKQTNDGSETCLTCFEYGRECTRIRQAQTRGKKAGIKSHAKIASDVPGTTSAGCGSSAQGAGQLDRQLLEKLLVFYIDTVHPVYPIYCEREIWLGFKDGSFPNTAAEWSTFTAMCCLSMYHAQEGALFSRDADFPSDATLYAELRQDVLTMIPTDFVTHQSLELVRSYAFMILLGLETKDYGLAHKFLALWHGLCGMMALHEEDRWPQNLTECDTEMRRRLFWILYRLELQMSYISGHIIRCPEAQCQVGYPKGTHHPPFVPGRNGLFEDWFKGWNRTNDVYKLLEHAITRLRLKQRKKFLAVDSGPHDSELHTKLDELQRSMPAEFQQVYDRSTDSGRNRCGFQAISIMGTVFVARVVSGLATGQELSQTIQFAQSMILTLRAVPAPYLRAVAPCLVQNLKGIALILYHQQTAQKTTHDVAGLLNDIAALFKYLRPQGDETVASIERLAAHLGAQDTGLAQPATKTPTPFEVDDDSIWATDDLAIDFANFLESLPPNGSGIFDVLEI